MRQAEKGQALMATIVAMSLVLLALLTALSLTQFSGKAIQRQLTYQGQGLNAAQAGIAEGLSWFRRQAIQPVQTFNPLVDVGGVCTHVPAHAPLINDTEETREATPATIGILRNYKISDQGFVYGRYLLRFGNAPAGSGVLDLSQRRGKPVGSTGLIWQIESVGSVYIQNDPTREYNVLPNIVLTEQTIRSEIQRIGLTLPDDAAIFSRRASLINIAGTSKIQGVAGRGLSYPPATGSAVIAGTASVSGAPSASQNPNPYDINSVFGVTQQELIGLSDINVTQASDLPATLPAMRLIVITGNATFDSVRPLVGSGILVVFGNVDIQANSNSNWSGVIYTTGNYVQAQPSLVSGAIVAAGSGGVGGSVTINSVGDVSQVVWDEGIIDQIRIQMGVYRFSRGMYIPGS